MKNNALLKQRLMSSSDICALLAISPKRHLNDWSKFKTFYKKVQYLRKVDKQWIQNCEADLTYFLSKSAKHLRTVYTV